MESLPVEFSGDTKIAWKYRLIEYARVAECGWLESSRHHDREGGILQHMLRHATQE
jgi:hypothetical protein